ncbi:hypothetical protein MUK42_17056 [Musa troglodytarum]|uniref:Uncharacterized protein n=1 Tax=Musa troglodytarum TaxID=320322 RepID=A0A9E7GW23_9LILI|nr:hypothetical protein MUK42_17056 [Musa troglodytarum]
MEGSIPHQGPPKASSFSSSSASSTSSFTFFASAPKGTSLASSNFDFRPSPSSSLSAPSLCLFFFFSFTTSNTTSSFCTTDSGAAARLATIESPPVGNTTFLSHSAGVFSFGFPCLSRRPSAIIFFFISALGPRPHFLGNPQSDGFTLCGHQHNFLPNLDIILKSQQSRNHQLCSIANSIDCGVLDNQPLVAGEQHLQWHHHPSQVALILEIVIHPLGIQHIMHGRHVILLAKDPRADPPQFLHVPSDAKDQTEMDAEGTNIGSSLAGDPEDNQVPVGVVLKQLALVDSPDAELTLDGGDERGPLEDGTGEGLEGASDLGDVGDSGEKAGDADVLLACALLGLDKAGGAVDADDEVAGDLGVQGAAVASLLSAEDAFDPSDHLMGGRVGGLVEVEDAVAEVLRERPLQRGVPGGERRVVAGADIEAVVVLEEDRPRRGVDGRGERLGFDKVVLVLVSTKASGGDKREGGALYAAIGGGLLIVLLFLPLLLVIVGGGGRRSDLVRRRR